MMHWIFEHREFVWGILTGISLLIFPAAVMMVLSLHAYHLSVKKQPDVQYEPFRELRCEQCGQVFSVAKWIRDPECPICVNGRGV